MAGEALFIGWGQIVRGREKQALQVFQESMEYYGKLQQEGRIEGFDVLLLSHGGDLDGFVVLRGDRTGLAQIRFSDRVRAPGCPGRGDRRLDRRDAGLRW